MKCPRLANLAGTKFGRLLVIKKSVPTIHRAGRWECLCDCGEVLVVEGQNLKSGNTKSCGCYKKEVMRKRKQPSLTIKISNTLRYYKRNAKLAGNEWDLSKEFATSLFLRSCAYCGHSSGLCGIDRVDNKKGYVENNCVPCCRWCNWGKNERTLEEFKNWVKNLHVILFHG